MMREISTVVLVFGLAVLAGASTAYAQGSIQEVVVSVPVDFNVGEQAFTAGDYRFTHRGAGAPTLLIRPVKGGESTAVPIVTRLAIRNAANGSGETNLVFDIVGGKHQLSEVWMPGQDGYLLRGVADEHEHAIVKMQR